MLLPNQQCSIARNISAIVQQYTNEFDTENANNWSMIVTAVCINIRVAHKAAINYTVHYNLNGAYNVS